jgi:nicotinamidase-related amidase
MSVVLSFDRFRQRKRVPPLVLVDMFEDQRGRAPSIRSEDVSAVLTNCRLLLDNARSIGWPLGFTVDAHRLHQKHHLGAAWIDGFRPHRSDMVFETEGDSCYSSAEFAEAVTSTGNCFLLAGFSGARTCLTTLIDAPNHGHCGGIVEDACYVPALNGLDALASHRALIAVVSSYATTLTTTEWLNVGDTSRSELEPFHDAER